MGGPEFTDEFPDGFFFIRCKATEMALDVYGGGMLNDYQLIIWPQKMVDSINQLWMHENGFLINRKSGLVLDIRGGEIKKDKAVIQYARKPGLADNQRWTYKDGFIFPTASPNFVLDIRGGEFKETSTIFLNNRNQNSITQQWLIQPFEDAKSKEDLLLLRPPPLEKHLTALPQPDELCDFHRLIYIDHKMPASVKEISGALAFEVLRVYVRTQKKKHEPLVTQSARSTLQNLVGEELQRLPKALVDGHNLTQLQHIAENATQSYFAREYEDH